MNAYLDSSIITKCYVREAESDAAVAFVQRLRPPIVLTHLHRVELVTAWHLKVFRKEIAIETVGEAMAHFYGDIEDGVWSPPAYDLATVFDRARALAVQFAPRIGSRSLEALHVAAAMELDTDRFVTADGRQAALAGAAGLRCQAFQ